MVDFEAAEVMNDYYVNMGSNLARDFNCNWTPSDFFKKLNVTMFSFRFVMMANIPF